MARIPLSGLATLIVSTLLVANNLLHPPKNFLSWDIYGYYLYLPQAFIYDDLEIRDQKRTVALMKEYKSSDTFYQAEKLKNGRSVMKYTLGMAVLYYPFFEIGHQVAKATGQKTDGYSPPYPKAVFWGCILYSLLGILLLRKILVTLFDDLTAAISLVLIVLGTNYWFHVGSSGQNGMTHNALFTLYAMILWGTLRWHQDFQWKHILLAGFGCGMAILVRPTEGIALLIPLLYGICNWHSLKEKGRIIWQKKLHVLAFSVVVLALVSLQLAYWKAMSGHWVTNSYGGNPGEGLDFNQPHVLELLFSFRKGWLLYTPVMAFALIGLGLAWKYQKQAALALVAFTMINLYVVSCWTVWWYGPSFSQRPMISTYPLMAVGLGSFIAWAKGGGFMKKISFASLAVALVALNMFQVWQYQKGIINVDRMTGAYYKKSFLQTEKDPAWEVDLLPLRYSFDDNVIHFPELYKSRLYKVVDALPERHNADTFAFSPPLSAKISAQNPYSMALEFPFHELTQKDHAWLKVSAMVYPKDETAVKGIRVVFHFSHGEKPYAYSARSIPPENLKPGTWNRVSFNYLTPEIRNVKDKFKSYVWMSGKSEAWVDDFSLEILERE